MKPTATDGICCTPIKPPVQCPAAGVLSHYKSLLEVEDAFRELKTYLKVRPVYHYRADPVVNHIRLCFLAYWLSARLGREWGLEGNHEEVVRVLRRLQTIRVGGNVEGWHRLPEAPLRKSVKGCNQEDHFDPGRVAGCPAPPSSPCRMIRRPEAS